MSARDYLPGGSRPAVGPRPGERPPRDLSVLIVGYRRADLLARCLTAVGRYLPDCRVLVWDNSGPDADLDEVMAQHPDVSWTRSPVNVGFAAAVNALVEQAGDDDVLLLNPDAELTGTLWATRAALGSGAVAAAAPRVVDGRQPGRTDWDVAHRRLGLASALVAHAGYGPRLRGRRASDLYATAPEEVDGYLTGACLLVSRDAWRAVGPFDEEFFLYGEEADWQRRAHRAGWRLVLTRDAGARHAGHGTVAGDPLAERRSHDLLRANIALGLEHDRGVHVADSYLAGTSLLDRVQRSSRRARARQRTTPMRERPAVVLTINRLGFGGAERHHVLLAHELQRRGYEVTIACMQRLGPLVREIGPTVRVVRQPWWAPALDVGPGPAVVISGDTNTETGFAALWRRARRDRRWLAAAHIPPAGDGPTYGRTLAAAMRAADGFVALSPRHRDEVSAHQRVGSRTYLAPNGVEVPATEQAERAPGRPMQLVMLSRIVELKNPHLLVAALARLSDLDWELSIFGDGPDRTRLEALTPVAVRDRVHWRGWSPGPEHALRDCDLFCLPSRSEAFPLVLLEAMARSIPVIASAVCSVPDMLDDGRAGLLVDPVDVDSWTHALRAALAEPDRLAELGRAGHERLRSHYTVAAMTDAYEAAIADVLATPARVTRNR